MIHLHSKVKCGVRGDTGPACNAVGLIDRTVLGIQHLYRKPIYARTVVIFLPSTIWFYILISFFSRIVNIATICFLQLCSINSPDYGPLPPDAPSWCQAPFDPEGLLRFVYLENAR